MPQSCDSYWPGLGVEVHGHKQDQSLRGGSGRRQCDRLTERPHFRLLSFRIMASASVSGGLSYPGHNFSIFQLLDAAKRKLRGSAFGGRYVWNYTYRYKNLEVLILESCRISTTMTQAEVTRKHWRKRVELTRFVLLLVGRYSRTGRVRSAQLCAVHEEQFRACQHDTLGSLFADPGVLGER